MMGRDGRLRQPPLLAPGNLRGRVIELRDCPWPAYDSGKRDRPGGVDDCVGCGVDATAAAAGGVREPAGAVDDGLRDLQKQRRVCPGRERTAGDFGAHDALMHDERAAVVEGDGAEIAVRTALPEFDALVGDVACSADRRAAAGDTRGGASELDEGCAVRPRRG